MSKSALANNLILHLQPVWRAGGVWRRRWWRKEALLALLVLSTLVLGEPLACIIHCQFLLPSGANSHLHHHHAAASATLGATVANLTVPVVASGAPESTTPFVCYMLPTPRTPGDIPSPLPPSPVHEVVTVIVALLAFLLLVLLRLCERARPIPYVVLPPPLRPPIPFAV